MSFDAGNTGNTGSTQGAYGTGMWSDVFGNAANIFTTAGQTSYDTMSSAAEDAYKSATSSFEGAADRFVEGALGNSAKYFGSADDKTSIPGKINTFAETVKSVFTSIGNAFSSFFSSIGDFFTKTFPTNTAEGSDEDQGSSLKSTGEKIKSVFVDFGETIFKFLTSISDGLSGFSKSPILKDVANTYVKAKYQGAKESVKEKLQENAEAAQAWFKNLWATK
jgi:hypothetical protein